MGSWHSYGSIYALGHKAVADLLTVPVIVQEKIDGSQFSFGLIEGELRARSKGKELVIDAPEKLFSLAVKTVRALHDKGLLHPEWTYRGECVSKPRHNVLSYGRVPEGNVILFDIAIGEEDYLGWDLVQEEAKRLGLEYVPTLWARRQLLTKADIEQAMKTESCLGGTLIEGVVVKPLRYDLFGMDKKVLMGKYVSEAFKEKATEVWGPGTQGKGPVIEQIITALRTEARWQKAIIHLREQDLIQDSPKDIGILIGEIKADLAKEEKEWIMQRIFKEFYSDIERGVLSGFPEWYKKQLLEKQFDA